MRAVVVSLLLLLPLASAAPYTGNERMVSDEPVELTEAAVGDDFVAWSDSRRGVSDVYIRPQGGEVFRLTLSDPNRESNFHPAADGRWVAWVRFAEATPDPSEQGGDWSREYVVYDTQRQAKVYESGTAGRDEDRLVVAGGRLGFLATPTDGHPVFTVTDLSGPMAFVEEVPLDSGPHGPPTMSDSHAAFLDHHEGRWRIVAVDLETMAIRVVADEPDVGYMDPSIDGSRLAWVEFRDGEATVRITDLAGDEDRSMQLPAKELHRISLRGDLLVAEARNQTRFLLATCIEEGTVHQVPGHNPVRSFPVLTSWDAVVYVSAVHGSPYLWEMPISCEPLAVGDAAPGQQSPGIGWLVAIACLAFTARTTARWSPCGAPNRR